MEKKTLQQQIELGEGIEASISEGELKIKGPKGEFSRKFNNPGIKMEIKDKSIIISSKLTSKREKKIIGTIKAHIKNIIKGCTEPYVYTLKICSGHFPMNVALNKDELVVKNFFGEKHPRVLKIKPGAEVKVEGDLINITGVDKEVCGQIAANIEKLTKRTAYDRRIFQDGIYIIKKDQKEIK